MNIYVIKLVCRVKKTAPSGPNLDAMVAECMKDYNDEDLSDTEVPSIIFVVVSS